jgi:serine/threonine-protein kinase
MTVALQGPQATAPIQDAGETESGPPASGSPAATTPIRWDEGMEKIGEYMVRRLVGEGGMGRVYEAEERLSKRRVALKVLREELSRSERARSLFLNEMQILAHLEHPNIVRSLASIEADGKLVTVLEYLQGHTLRDVLNVRGRLGWEEACYVVSCVARALSAAHGQSPPVIHRDLKPENIMVLGDGTVKVMDFGIAKLVQELNQTNTQSVGTLQYMSPEQIDARPVDHRTDLYCLGLVFYELLTGRPPFVSSSPRTLLNMQCSDPPPPLDDEVRAGVAKGIQRLIFGLLEKAPDKRPNSAAAVVEQLEPFLPERRFGDLIDPSTVAATSSDARTPHAPVNGYGDTMPSGDERPAGVAPTQPDRLEEPPARQMNKGMARKDTVALIDEASSPRELSTGISIAIILLLMLVAGIATYVWRASQAEDGGDETRTEQDNESASEEASE